MEKSKLKIEIRLMFDTLAEQRFINIRQQQLPGVIYLCHEDEAF